MSGQPARSWVGVDRSEDGISKVVVCLEHSYKGTRGKEDLKFKVTDCAGCEKAAKDDRYQVQVNNPFGTSNLKKTVHGLQAAEAKRVELAGLVATGDVAQSHLRNITFGELLTKTVQLLHDERNHAADTRRTYANTCNNHLLPALGARRVKDLQGQELALRTLLLGIEKTAGPAARKHAEMLLRQTLKTARRQSIITRDPLEGVPWPKQPRRSARKRLMFVPTLEQAALVRAHVVQQRRGVTAGEHEMFLARHDVLFGTGYRIGELLGIAIGDVDFDNAKLKLDRQLRYAPKQGLYFKAPKNDSYRTIPLPDFVLEAIRSTVDRNGTRTVTLPWHSILTEKELAEGMVQQYHTAELIFFNLRRGSNTVATAPAAVEQRLAAIGRGVGIEPNENGQGLHPHSYRHLYTSILENAGVPQSVIDEVTGHEPEGSVTNKIYTHGMEKGRRKVVPALDEAWAEVLGRPQDEAVVESRLRLVQ